VAFGLSILLFVIALFAIVMIHEGGHYLGARLYNFRVLEYFIGFGPRLWSFRRGEIEYGVKAIPAGGYVKIAGMNPFENDVPLGDEARAYGAKPVRQRIVVILAGPMSHFLVAWLIFAAVFMFSANWNVPGVNKVVAAVAATPAEGSTGIEAGDHITRIGNIVDPTDEQITAYQNGHVGQPVPYVVERDGKPVQLTLIPDASPAALGGLKPGDVIEQIGDINQPTRDQIGTYQAAHVGQPITYVVDRNGESVTLSMTPVVTTLKDGTQVVRVGVLLSGVREPPLLAFAHAGGQVWDTTVAAVAGLAHVFGPSGVHAMLSSLFEGAPRQTNGAVSLVGASQAAGHAGSQGAWAYFFSLFATVVLFIGLVNLLPLPPLDGGHVAIALIEKVRGHAIDMKKVVPVSAVVLLILGFFSISAIILDIWKPIPGT
jgi:RIP metalloprotease RseP